MVDLTGPEQALLQAEALLHSMCSTFEKGCVKSVLVLEKHKAAAFTEAGAGATAQLLAQRAEDIGRRHKVLVQVDLASVQGISSSAFNGVKVHVRS